MDHQETKDLKTKRKEKRKRLFHHSKPNIRTFEGLDDLLWLWTSYKLENPETEHTEQSFIQEFGNVFLSYDFVYVIEDGNKKLPENHGIIAFVYGVVDDDGWKYEPHVHYMMWATKKEYFTNNYCLSAKDAIQQTSRVYFYLRKRINIKTCSIKLGSI